PPAIQFADASGISTLHGSTATLVKDFGSPLHAAARRKMEAAAISVAGRLTQAKVENRSPSIGGRHQRGLGFWTSKSLNAASVFKDANSGISGIFFRSFSPSSM